MKKFKLSIGRPGPWLQMTMALVGLCTMLVLLADLFFGVLPDRDLQLARQRQSVADNLAVHATLLLRQQQTEPEQVQRILDALLEQTPGLRSLAVRRADGKTVAQTGHHDRYWQAQATARQAPEQVKVTLHSGTGVWGQVELAFARDERPWMLILLQQPLTQTLMFITFAGAIVFALYLRRVLQHLDPASTIPDRVQNAFDVMAEGVVILDDQGRVLLTNKAFRGLHAQAGELQPGTLLSAVPWLTASLGTDEREHPWLRTIADRTTLSGLSVVLGEGTPEERRLHVNCTPITDAGGAIRGCMTTFDDVSALHRSNEALRNAVEALNQSNEKVQRQNAELERLATRDPLTGCLNRRAFLTAFDQLIEQAQDQATPLSCLMLDIDHFKSVNDRYGHAIGDRVIQEVAKRMQVCARSTDLVGRYGGEEFCMALPGLDIQGATELAERVRTRIELECAASVREVTGLQVSASLGVESFSRFATTSAQMLDQADQALYLAKRTGRNRVVAFANQPETAEVST